MNLKRGAKLGSVFLLALLVTVAAVNAGSVLNPTGQADQANPQSVSVNLFQPNSILAENVESSGTIEMSANASGETILIELGHGNDVSEEQLGPLIRTVTENGGEVDFLTRDEARGREFNESLRKADAYISISPSQTYTDSQLAGLQAFERAGGRILLMQEPNQMMSGYYLGYSSSRATQPASMAPLASQFGLSFGNGYLYNMQDNHNNYRTIIATTDTSNQLSTGVDELAIREGTVISGGSAFLTTDDGTVLSSTRQESTYSVAARSGNVTAIGDTTILTESGYQNLDNEVLVGNLLDFLVRGDKVPGAPKEPKPERGNDTQNPPTTQPPTE